MSEALYPVEPGLERPLEHLRSVLIPGETLEACARREFEVARQRDIAQTD